MDAQRELIGARHEVFADGNFDRAWTAGHRIDCLPVDDHFGAPPQPFKHQGAPAAKTVGWQVESCLQVKRASVVLFCVAPGLLIPARVQKQGCARPRGCLWSAARQSCGQPEEQKQYSSVHVG